MMPKRRFIDARPTQAMPRFRPPIPRHPTGFTVVELLVVISIIILLIAMLLPALRKSRYEARSLLCGTRKKQLSAALTEYANDFNGSYPHRWPQANTYNHPFWWGKPNNATYDMSNVVAQYFGDSGTKPPEMLLCSIEPRAIWGVDIPWPLSGIYRTNVAVTAGWDWTTISSSAAVPQQDLGRIPLKMHSASADTVVAFDLIEYMTGDSVNGYSGWVIGHTSDAQYHFRRQSGPEDLPPEGIPFAYADGNVQFTTNLEPFYRDPGWGMKFWAAP